MNDRLTSATLRSLLSWIAVRMFLGSLGIIGISANCLLMGEKSRVKRSVKGLLGWAMPGRHSSGLRPILDHSSFVIGCIFFGTYTAFSLFLEYWDFTTPNFNKPAKTALAAACLGADTKRGGVITGSTYFIFKSNLTGSPVSRCLKSPTS